MKPAPIKPARGRPKTLDREQVLRVALESFWSEGPTAVSVNEICKRAGVSKPGLYREFGGEDGLKRAVLEVYRDIALAPLLKVIDTDQPFKQTIDELIKLTSEDRAKSGIPTGCLFTQMRQCRKKLGPETQEVVDQNWEMSQARLKDWIDRAKAKGQLGAEISTTTAALYVDAQIASAIGMQKEGVAQEHIEEFLHWALGALPTSDLGN